MRDGARQMLAAALRAEVAAYIEAHTGEVDENGHRLLVLRRLRAGAKFEKGKLVERDAEQPDNHDQESGDDAHAA